MTFGPVIKPEVEAEPEWKPYRPASGRDHFFINAQGHIKYQPPIKPLWTHLPYMGPNGPVFPTEDPNP